MVSAVSFFIVFWLCLTTPSVQTSALIYCSESVSARVEHMSAIGVGKVCAMEANARVDGCRSNRSGRVREGMGA